jgi:hypothetical protein
MITIIKPDYEALSRLITPDNLSHMGDEEKRAFFYGLFIALLCQFGHEYAEEIRQNLDIIRIEHNMKPLNTVG